MHPYFKGINFSLLHQTSPPVPADRYNSFFNVKRNITQRDLDEVMSMG
jgi:hypothetical protein